MEIWCFVEEFGYKKIKIFCLLSVPGNDESYEITKETFVIDHDQFLPEYSHVKYPAIKFSDDAINDSIDIWLENKEEFIEEWKEDERAPLHGWYLYEGRIGFFFGIPTLLRSDIFATF